MLRLQASVLSDREGTFGPTALTLFAHTPLVRRCWRTKLDLDQFNLWFTPYFPWREACLLCMPLLSKKAAGTISSQQSVSASKPKLWGMGKHPAKAASTSVFTVIEHREIDEISSYS